MAAQLDGDAGAADDVARAGGGVDGGEAGIPHLVDGVIVRVDGVERADVRLDGAGHLVAVRKAGHRVRLTEVADMGMAVDQSRGDPAAGSVDDFGVGGDLHVRPHRFDLAVFDQDGGFVIGLSGDGKDFTIDNRFHDSMDSSFK